MLKLFKSSVFFILVVGYFSANWQLNVQQRQLQSMQVTLGLIQSGRVPIKQPTFPMFPDAINPDKQAMSVPQWPTEAKQ